MGYNNAVPGALPPLNGTGAGGRRGSSAGHMTSLNSKGSSMHNRGQGRRRQVDQACGVPSALPSTAGDFFRTSGSRGLYKLYYDGEGTSSEPRRLAGSASERRLKGGPCGHCLGDGRVWGGLSKCYVCSGTGTMELMEEDIVTGTTGGVTRGTTGAAPLRQPLL